MNLLKRAVRLPIAAALVGSAMFGLSTPAGAQTGPTITVAPTGPRFQDFQKISVSYSGFKPNFDLIVRQCAVGPRSGDDCDILTLVTSRTGANGAGTRANYELRKLPRPELDSGVVCNETIPCVIVVSEDLNDFSQPKAISAPINVAAQAPEPVIPEVPWALALPLTAMALGLGAWQVGRRRQPSPLAG